MKLLKRLLKWSLKKADEQQVPQPPQHAAENEEEALRILLLERIEELEQQNTELSRQVKQERESAQDALDALTCVVCLDATRDCLYMPCAHLATCAACDVKLENDGSAKCAVCQGDIAERVRGVRLP